jgi:hypothetical protein
MTSDHVASQKEAQAERKAEERGREEGEETKARKAKREKPDTEERRRGKEREERQATGTPLLIPFSPLSSSQLLSRSQEPQNIVAYPPSLASREAVWEASRVVDRLARDSRPSEDRVIGNIDFMKGALRIPKFSETVPSDKVAPFSLLPSPFSPFLPFPSPFSPFPFLQAVLMVWLHKLQLSYTSSPSTLSNDIPSSSLPSLP